VLTSLRDLRDCGTGLALNLRWSHEHTPRASACRHLVIQSLLYREGNVI